jgi:hydroxyacylglutathione hydrolase
MPIHPIRAFTDNYIWMLQSPDDANAWVVDPGDSDPVLKVLTQQNLNLEGILITHHHHDHTGGIGSLLNRYSEAPVIGSHKSPIQAITRRVKEGDVVQGSFFQLKVLEIPGHTLDHLAFYNNELVFTGDTLFSCGCGKVFEGTPEQMYHSLQKLASLPEKLHVYCGHEYTLANLSFAKRVSPENIRIDEKIKSVTTMLEQGNPSLPSVLQEEKLLNPFLKTAEPEIQKSVSQHYAKNITDPIETFALLREWKNHG